MSSRVCVSQCSLCTSEICHLRLFYVSVQHHFTEIKVYHFFALSVCVCLWACVYTCVCEIIKFCSMFLPVAVCMCGN